MQEEKYVLNCPRCGRVEGYIASATDDEDAGPESDALITEQHVRAVNGPATRMRCPRCGTWINPDRIRPA